MNGLDSIVLVTTHLEGGLIQKLGAMLGEFVLVTTHLEGGLIQVG